MILRPATRAVLETPWRLPPTFLLPLRVGLSTTTRTRTTTRTTTTATTATATAPAPATPGTSTSTSTSEPVQQSLEPLITWSPPETQAAPAAPPAMPAPLPPSVTSLLPLLASQPPYYATIHIHARAYLVTEGDVVRLPFRMPDVLPGDVLRLNRASIVGSRDFTLKGAPYVDDRLYECRAVVVGVESEPMRFKEKTTRRNRRVTTVKSKHRYTELRVRELRVRGLDEVESSPEVSVGEGKEGRATTSLRSISVVDAISTSRISPG